MRPGNAHAEPAAPAAQATHVAQGTDAVAAAHAAKAATVRHAAPAYRPDIDGLRAIAILTVVLYHAWPALLPSGFIGVDVFFVISGTLIAGQIGAELRAGHFSFASFYFRRARRILPALVVVLAATWLAGWVLLFPDEFVRLGAHLREAALFATNFALLREAGYFDAAAELKPLLHLWSLAVEEQFYIVFPALLALAWRLRLPLWAVTGVCALASFAAGVVETARAPVGAFYLPWTRLWELLLGATWALWPGVAGLANPTNPASAADAANAADRSDPASASAHGPDPARRAQRWRDAASLAGAVLLAAGLALIEPRTRFPGTWALLPTGGALLLIAAGPTALLNRLVLARRGMVFVGLISYPLYLWHWPLLSYLRIVEGPRATPLQIGIAVVIAVVLAIATWRLIERPLKRATSGTAQRPMRRRLVIGLTASLALMLVVGQATLWRQGFDRPFADTRIALADIANFESFRTGLTPCTTQFTPRLDFSWCSLSKPGAPRYALFGDSHADQYFPGLAAADTAGWLFIGQSSCAPLLGTEAHKQGETEKCAPRNSEAVRLIAATPSIEVVVLASLGAYYVSDSGLAMGHTGDNDAHWFVLRSTVPGEEGLGKAQAFAAGLERTVAALETAGKRVVLVADVAEIPYMPKDCIGRPFASSVQSPCALSRAAILARQAGYRAALDAVRARHPRTVLFDPLTVLCEADRCPILAAGRALYRDSHHLSLYGSGLVAPQLQRAVDAAPGTGPS